MAVPAIVALLGTAAKIYIEKLATEVAGGIKETLFNQGAIREDLDAIKAQLAALSDFIVNKLPQLVLNASNAALAHQREVDIVEKVSTIAGSIRTLREAKINGRSGDEIGLLTNQLVDYCNQILEMGGALIEYGQAYYAAVGTAYAAGLNGYATAVELRSEHFNGMYAKAGAWRSRLAPWVDEKRPESMKAKLIYLSERLKEGEKCVPWFETWTTGTTQEIALSYNTYGGTMMMISGGWWGYTKDRGLQGDTLGWWADPAKTFEQTMAGGVLPNGHPVPRTVEWWPVKANVPASMADYDAFGSMLNALCVDYYLAKEVVAPLSKGVAVIEATIASCDKILSQRQLVMPDPAPAPPVAVVQDWVQVQRQRFEQLMAGAKATA